MESAGPGTNISRRHFLGGLTGCAATLWSLHPIGLGARVAQPGATLDCVLLDLNSHCVLPESLQGYQAALPGEHRLLSEADLNSRRICRTAIVPSFGAMAPATASTLTDLLEAGTHVLLESGAGFLSPAEFTAHQRMLLRHFDIAVDPPVDLWKGNPADDALPTRRPERHPKTKRDRHPSVPYVSYLWPRETRVRDFSCVIPVSASDGDVIGRVGALPVALKRHVGRGTLIFLGSPLGPALRAGDPEALSWLRLVTAL
jgi:hypothetical protein